MRDPSPVRWSVAVFAYNEARRIRDAVESIEAAAEGAPISITVLANGCRDATAHVVRMLAADRPHLRLLEIALADKANAWNTYVHEAQTDATCAGTAMHVFVDGDVRVERGALPALAAALEAAPSANAVGGMPATGRDRDAWRQRMIGRGMLAGNLYALQGRFVERLRARRIRIPTGFIGEDWLVSALAGSNLLSATAWGETPGIVFSPDARFSFRSLDPLRPRDYRTYARRLWRYALREVQFEMLMPLLAKQSLAAMPADVNELYRRCLPPSRMKWVGRRSLLRFLAVQHVRSLRARALQP